MNNAVPFRRHHFARRDSGGHVFGVGAGETCGIDLVSEGVYHVTDGDREVEFTIEP